MSGGVQVRDHSKNVMKVVRNLTAERFKEYTETIVEIAKEEAPVITGNLRRSLNHDQQGPLVRRVFTQSGYGGYVHEGAGKRAPNPFIQRAIDRANPEFENSGPWA